MTTYSTLISATDLAALAASSAAGLVVCDCRFDLADPAAGQRAYDAGHLPGAVYAHLEALMSGAKTGHTGRHPLPEREAFVEAVAALGIGDATQVVGYDDAGGMFAARLWWLLRWIGHDAVAVLDGGLTAWKAAGQPLTIEAPPGRPPGNLTLGASATPTVIYEQVRANLDSREQLVIDARAADRFRGENETIDPVAGHIPGAKNRPFKENLGADGRFKPAVQLRAEFDALTGGRPANELISQCGSGVTAAHNLLALEVAGLRGAALYPGSWSEWVAHRGAPIATGG